MRAALIFALLAAPAAAAGAVYDWMHGASYVRLQATDEPGAVAEVEFRNARVHADQDLTIDLSLDGLTLTVLANVGRGETPDRIQVICPLGYFAVPEFIDVPELDMGTIVIYPDMLLLG
jgi:hypothetical protein